MLDALHVKKVLVTPDPSAHAWIEKAIRDVGASRGRPFGRGNLLAAVARSLAESRFGLAGCRSEAHVTARLTDVIIKGLAPASTLVQAAVTRVSVYCVVPEEKIDGMNA